MGNIDGGNAPTNHSSRRRSALEFGDNFQAWRFRFQRLQQAMRHSRSSNLQCVFAKLTIARLPLKPRHHLAFFRENFEQKIPAHYSRFVSRTSASSFDAARPLSMLSRANIVAS